MPLCKEKLQNDDKKFSILWFFNCVKENMLYKKTVESFQVLKLVHLLDVISICEKKILQKLP